MWLMWSALGPGQVWLGSALRGTHSSSPAATQSSPCLPGGSPAVHPPMSWWRGGLGCDRVAMGCQKPKEYHGVAAASVTTILRGYLSCLLAPATPLSLRWSAPL